MDVADRMHFYSALPGADEDSDADVEAEAEAEAGGLPQGDRPA
jgi:hypothetical protein